MGLFSVRQSIKFTSQIGWLLPIQITLDQNQITNILTLSIHMNNRKQV